MGSIQNVGMDYNFYKEVVVAGVGSFPTDCQALMRFRGPRRMMFVCTSGSIEYSFNGNTVHGSMDSTNPSSILNFGTRMEDKVWISGTGTIQIHSWHIGV